MDADEDRQGKRGRSLYVAMAVLMALRVALHPYLPFSAQRLHELLGQSGKVEDVGWTLETPVPGAEIPSPQLSIRSWMIRWQRRCSPGSASAGHENAWQR